jgi:NitT/TauT family transport system substrate-binding protein
MTHASSHLSRALFAAGAITAALAGPGRAQTPVTIGLPGIPPVFVTTQAFVAKEQKFFDKHGVNVTLRSFDSGAAAARAVVAGDIALSISPTPLIAAMVSNVNADVVGIYGWPKPDWLVGSMDGGKVKCEDLKGQPVGVDSLGGARSIALNQMARKCGLTANDTQQVALGSNVGSAMVAGQLTFGVLHIDDVPVVERESGKPLHTVIDINDVTPINHYMALVTRRENVDKERDALTAVVAALIEAERFMRDPANADRVAEIAAPTGRAPADARHALGEYLRIGFWPHDSDGMLQRDIDAVIAVQERVGAIRPGASPVTFARLVDGSIYRAATKTPVGQ